MPAQRPAAPRVPCARVLVDVTAPARTVRRNVLAALRAARAPLGDVDDVPGGGFRVHDVGRTRSLVVAGLGSALRDRVYADGLEHVRDVGPSTASTGCRVHRHVFHLVECIGHGAACKCGTRFRKPRHANKGAREIVRALEAAGTRAAASEVALVDTAWNVATRADLVCADAEGRIVLVSVKTGAASTASTARALRGGLAHMLDTQFARHQVQLAAERLMLEKAGVRVHRGLIIYCAPRGEQVRSVRHDPRLWSADGSAALDLLMRGPDRE